MSSEQSNFNSTMDQLLKDFFTAKIIDSPDSTTISEESSEIIKLYLHKCIDTWQQWLLQTDLNAPIDVIVKSFIATIPAVDESDIIHFFEQRPDFYKQVLIKLKQFKQLLILLQF